MKLSKKLEAEVNRILKGMDSTDPRDIELELAGKGIGYFYTEGDQETYDLIFRILKWAGVKFEATIVEDGYFLVLRKI